MKPVTNIVFVGGWAHPAHTLRALGEALRPASDCRYAAVSEPADPTGSPADALARLVNERPGPCAIIAWSMGALVTLELLAAHKVNPAWTALIAPTARFCSAPDYPYGVTPAALKAMKKGIRTRPAKTLPTFFRNCSLPRALPDDALDTLVTAAAAYGPDALCSGLDYLEHTDLRDKLQGIQTPTLVIHGDSDGIIPVDAGRFAANRLPHADLVVHAGAGHDLPQAFPALVAADILRRFP